MVYDPSFVFLFEVPLIYSVVIVPSVLTRDSVKYIPFLRHIAQDDNFYQTVSGAPVLYRRSFFFCSIYVINIYLAVRATWDLICATWDLLLRLPTVACAF